MAKDAHVYGKVDNQTELRAVYRQIRADVKHATTRPELTELYRRAGYLVTLSHASAWKKKFKGEIGKIRQLAEDAFASTARKINARAEEVGTTADYDETWGDP